MTADARGRSTFLAQILKPSPASPPRGQRR
jgi:hypothetical protein